MHRLVVMVLTHTCKTEWSIFVYWTFPLNVNNISSLFTSAFPLLKGLSSGLGFCFVIDAMFKLTLLDFRFQFWHIGGKYKLNTCDQCGRKHYVYGYMYVSLYKYVNLICYLLSVILRHSEVYIHLKKWNVNEGWQHRDFLYSKVPGQQ